MLEGQQHIFDAKFNLNVNHVKLNVECLNRIFVIQLLISYRPNIDQSSLDGKFWALTGLVGSFRECMYMTWAQL